MRQGTRALAGLLLGGLSALTAVAPVGSPAAQELVSAQRGTMPVLLTAPHGGSATVPGVPPRTTGETDQDGRTRELADAVVRRLDETVCAQPYAVVALFHRRYIDANRPAAEAYEDPAAAPHYAVYHRSVRQLVDELRELYPTGALLVDLHGQGGDPARIHRGTRNGLTVSRGLDRWGPAALIGPASVLGRLQASGYDVFPPNTPPGDPPEDRRWNGGYTVATYGSQQADGIDALQLEFGSYYRQAERLPALAADLAAAIVEYAAAYLNASPRCS